MFALVGLASWFIIKYSLTYTNFALHNSFKEPKCAGDRYIFTKPCTGPRQIDLRSKKKYILRAKLFYL